LALPACSDAAGPSRSRTSSEGLEYIVTLPNKLGKMKQITHHPVTTPATQRYALGLKPSNKQPSGPGVKTKDFPTDQVPTEADLSQYAVPPGDQGQYGSCASWSTSYTNFGWHLQKNGLDGNPLNPLFVYSLVMAQLGQECGPNAGSGLTDPLQILVDTGEPSRADFASATCVDPTDADRDAASKHRITGFQQLDLSGGARAAISAAIAAGTPVTLGLFLTDQFMNANAQNYLVPAPDPGTESLGGHGITALAYDETGLWIENSWSERWGQSGWVELAWDYVDGTCTVEGRETPCVLEAVTIDGVADDSQP
jgi:hypothetical protein